ncbi:Unknown protein [Striga hermonthica]|uniref:Avr9/Cf-9 rapidly elicited protein 146 n=1 Tax=Striga hermonthica TaxID=68872 RepID=A0A9N7MP57_STRHE|nr:Unknown protein [Striga hermonthica]
MEQNLPIVTKKIWKIIRVLYLMVRKGISKGKLLADLATLMKRGKIAGKAAIHNLMFHHPAAGRRAAEYEFSCGNSPLVFGRTAVASPLDARALAAALEIVVGASAGASPALPGFGPSPLVRQLRITDSPFPVRDGEEDSRVVDEAAEEFIARFYKDLKRQNAMAYLGYS